MGKWASNGLKAACHNAAGGIDQTRTEVLQDFHLDPATRLALKICSDDIDLTVGHYRHNIVAICQIGEGAPQRQIMTLEEIAPRRGMAHPSAYLQHVLGIGPTLE